jgi:hypothetical protein
MGYAIISADSIIELRTLGYHRIDVHDEEVKQEIMIIFI